MQRGICELVFEGVSCDQRLHDYLRPLRFKLYFEWVWTNQGDYGSRTRAKSLSRLFLKPCRSGASLRAIGNLLNRTAPRYAKARCAKLVLAGGILRNAAECVLVKSGLGSMYWCSFVRR